MIPRPERTRVAILGTGGNSVDILDTINDINDAAGRMIYDCVGFLDDDPASWGTVRGGAKVLGPLATAQELHDCGFVNGIGSPSSFLQKPRIIARTGVEPGRFLTLVHPTASVSRTASLGRGVVVFQNVTITTNVQIGDHVIVLPNSVISHDDVVGAYTCIAGGVCISGNVQVGSSCYLGTNSSVIGGVTIGDGCLVGMGSVVLADVAPDSVVVGSPARFLRHTTGGGS
jgi:sugar O-acyltransferase (sialic acid O-acetyltransferase NeuD family)